MNRAIWTSVLVGLVTQLISLLVLRSLGRERMMIGWGLGALLRLVVLMAYGWVVVPALHLPLAPALLVLAGILFVTTLVEPLLLHDGRAQRGPTLS
jgi:hypothetical protein